MGVPWEYRGSTVAVLWQYCGSTVVLKTNTSVQPQYRNSTEIVLPRHH